MTTDTTQFLADLRAGGGIGNDAAALIEWLMDERDAILAAGDDYVIRKDSEHNLGVIYTAPNMIGQIVRMRDTGRRAKA